MNPYGYSVHTQSPWKSLLKVLDNCGFLTEQLWDGKIKILPRNDLIHTFKEDHAAVLVLCASQEKKGNRNH